MPKIPNKARQPITLSPDEANAIMGALTIAAVFHENITGAFQFMREKDPTSQGKLERGLGFNGTANVRFQDALDIFRSRYGTQQEGRDA